MPCEARGTSLLERVCCWGPQAAIRRSDLVLLTVGANDLPDRALFDVDPDPRTVLTTYRPLLSRQRTQLTTLLTRIRDLRGSRSGTVLVTGYWNAFLDGAQGRAQGGYYVVRSDLATLAENDVIRSAAKDAGAKYVDLYAPFKGDGTVDDTALLAPDGDHPNAAGHALIARTLLRALP